MDISYPDLSPDVSSYVAPVGDSSSTLPSFDPHSTPARLSPSDPSETCALVFKTVIMILSRHHTNE